MRLFKTDFIEPSKFIVTIFESQCILTIFMEFNIYTLYRKFLAPRKAILLSACEFKAGRIQISLNKTLPGQIQDWMKLMLAYEEGRTKKMWGKNKPACMYTVFQVKRIEVGVDMRYN